ncbi:MAG: AMP-binding protein [Planctomycetota bacterium]|nr:AMP-binding protein [Planctomycetota bacterium]
MSVLKNLFESLPGFEMKLESYDRRGKVISEATGGDVFEAVQRYRELLPGADGHQRIGLLFRSEETIEFLVAMFAAISRGLTVVPLYPNWDGPTQLSYLQRYGVRVLAVGDGFLKRTASWGESIDKVVNVSLDPEKMPGGAGEPDPAGIFPPGMDGDHPVAWIFTSGTSGGMAKCTEITLSNMDAAIENIRDLDFLREGMVAHCPLSASHIFAFVVMTAFIALKPRRVLLSDVQYLARLPEERTGKVDAIILVPIVINRIRSGFYDRLCTDFSQGKVPPELKKLARIPLGIRRCLKRICRRAEEGVIDREAGRSRGWLGLPFILLARSVFGRMVRSRLGSAEFMVLGGARPNLQAMAFFEVMGIRVLQGWGMTETTGPVSVSRLGDRRNGALGTCGELFPGIRAKIEGEELIVEGTQIARGYVEPDGTLVPFDGVIKTGDRAAFDKRGRLKVFGKVSDRITTDNGLNYLPVPMEDELKAADLQGQNVLEEAVVVGDARPRLGCVYFLREGLEHSAERTEYLGSLVRDFNSGRPVDEHIGPWLVSSKSLKECGGIGPSGKLVRRRIEEKFANLYEDAAT